MLALGIIIKYQQGKSLAMKTPLDQLSTDVAIFVGCNTCIQGALFVLILPIFGTLSAHQADQVAIFYYLVFCFTGSTILCTITYRYLCIFHSTWVATIDDDTTILASRGTGFAWSISCFILDWNFGRKGGLIFSNLVGLDMYR